MNVVRAFFRRWVSDPRYASAWILAILVLALVIIYGTAPDTVTQTTRLTTPEIPAHLVERKPVTLTLHSQGTAQARDRLALAFRSAGEVVEVSDRFANGGWVEAGEVLVKLDPEPFELEVAQRRHDVEAAKLHLEQAEANATMARRNPGRNATEFALNVPQLREAQARVDVAEAALRRSQNDLERSTMKAPFSGRLEQVNVSAGQTVGAGEPLGQIFSAGRMEVRLPVRDEWLNLMDVFSAEPGQNLNVPVKLSGDFGGRERHWDGVITRREGGISRNQMSWLIAEVDSESGSVQLEPGVYLNAEIQGRRVDNIAAIPRTAMINDTEVWVLDSSSRIHRREVEWVYRDDSYIYVNKGLSAGEYILEQGNAHLLEGAEIRVANDKSDNPDPSVASAAGER